MMFQQLTQRVAARFGRQGNATNRLILRAAAVVAICTFGVKIVAAAKESVMAAVFGINDVVDAFVIAALLPQFVVSLIANSCNAALIPTYIRVREREGSEAAQRLLSETVLVSGGLFLIITALLGLIGSTALAWLAPTFSPAKQELTRQLFLLSLPQVLLSGLATIWQSVLNARERFALGALAPVAVPVVSIVVLALTDPAWAIYALTISMSIGFVFQLALLGWALRRSGISLLPRWHGGGPALREVIAQYWPLVAGGLLVNSTPIVDRAMAATLPGGSVSALNYAYKIAALIIGLSTTALSTALIPYLSKMVAKADWKGVRHSLRTYTWLILGATIPVSLALAFGSQLLVSLVYERGAFTDADTALVAQVQAMYMLQIPFYTLHILFVRLISSLRANKLLMWGTLINFVLNIIFDYVLLQLMGLPGIALANTAVYAAKMTFVVVAGYWALRLRERGPAPTDVGITRGAAEAAEV